MCWPLMTVRYGWYPSDALWPIPTTASLDDAIASNVSCMPTGP